ncbi:hypothetical protein P9869_03545 [Streptomyces ossamyceticus]|nr:hypothetical protein [Streptomyces ossamyceticus]
MRRVSAVSVRRDRDFRRATITPAGAEACANRPDPDGGLVGTGSGVPVGLLSGIAGAPQLNRPGGSLSR